VPSEPDESAEEAVEHFAPTGGRITGVVGLVMAAGVVVLWLVDRDSLPAAVAAGAVLAGVLVWASLLRPRISASRETLFLRNMLETIHVPLAAVDDLMVRQVFTVRVGEKKYVCPAVGRKLRKVMRAPRAAPLLSPSMPDDLQVDPSSEPDRPATDIDYADHVEERVRDLVADARERHGIRRYSDEAEALARDVRRRPAWPEIAALVLSAGILVATLVL
jgi:hypothetical protein